MYHIMYVIIPTTLVWVLSGTAIPTYTSLFFFFFFTLVILYKAKNWLLHISTRIYSLKLAHIMIIIIHVCPLFKT